MNTDEFEALVLGAEENTSLEFKGPCEWSCRTFAKDILALANIQDGGFIVVGFEDGSLKRLGVSKSQDESFDAEVMQDQMSEFTDSFVSFSVHHLSGNDRKKFVVIRVSEFEEIPVISRIDKYDIHRGAVYYRSRRGRPASKLISNSYDMRDLIDRATVKMMAKRGSQGYEADNSSHEEYYDQEIGDL